MMKKMIRNLSFIFICICLALSVMIVPTNVTHAESAGQIVSNEIVQEMMDIVADYSNIKIKVAGSDGEREAASFIKNYLFAEENLKPTNMSSSDDFGVQPFRFTSAFDGKQYDSQNLSFSYTPKVETDKKVIIGCSYDSIAFNDNYEAIESDAVNGSAGSVALLIALAKYIPKFEPEYNIDFVFFGAGESNNAGSVYYTNGISKEESENILLMLNIDKVAVGSNLYFYSDEFENGFEKFVSGVSSRNKLGAKQIDTVHLNKILLGQPNEVGLNYYHIAQTSNNINFMKLGVLSLNLFAGDYEEGVVVGRSEYSGKDLVTYTANDNLDYISKTFGENVVENNLSSAFGFVQRVLTDTGFVKNCEAAAGKTEFAYGVFANSKLALYLTVVAFIISIIVAMIIYFKLSVRAYYADVDSQFASSVLSITENIGEGIKDIEIPKTVSQLLASDIKKDKRIKPKKKKHDDK